MAESKKSAVKTAETKAEEKAPETNAAAAETTVEEVKKTPAKRGPAKKETVKKDTVKKTPGRKPGTTAKKTTTTRATTRRKTEVSEVVRFEFSEKSYTSEELLKIAKDVWKYDLKKKPVDLKSIALYVKPEENLAYYVINGDVTGSFAI